MLRCGVMASELREKALECLMSLPSGPGRSLRVSIANAWLALAQHEEAMMELIRDSEDCSGRRLP